MGQVSVLNSRAEENDRGNCVHSRGPEKQKVRKLQNCEIGQNLLNQRFAWLYVKRLTYLGLCRLRCENLRLNFEISGFILRI